MHRPFMLLHYDELALKGGNRIIFERRLMSNLRLALQDFSTAKVQREDGRLIIFGFGDDHKRSKIAQTLQQVFGVANFLFVLSCAPSLDAMIDTAVRAMEGSPPGSTFRVSSRRVDKRFPVSSQAVNEKVGEAIVRRLGLKVQLTKPAKELRIEILPRMAMLGWERYAGLNGLPVGCSGRVLVMLSGGIDSPVAAFRMLGRGCEIEAIHFHSYPLTDQSSQVKAKQLCDRLGVFAQRSIPFHAVALGRLQQTIVKDAPEALRVLLYRYGMMMLAERLAHERKASALVTGEALGQVASQTIPNLTAVTAALTLPVFRPLIGMAKAEIITQAKKIGTYDISILPDQDCCSLFTPRHPATAATFAQLHPWIQSLRLNRLIENIYAEQGTQGLEPA